MTRIDHSNCNHPRTPAGRAACRRGGTTPAVTPMVETPVSITMGKITKGKIQGPKLSVATSHEALMANMNRHERARFAAKLRSDADRSAARNARRGRSSTHAEVTVMDPATLPMPKLTPAQLASPVFQSLLRKRA